MCTTRSCARAREKSAVVQSHVLGQSARRDEQRSAQSTRRAPRGQVVRLLPHLLDRHRRIDRPLRRLCAAHDHAYSESKQQGRPSTLQPSCRQRSGARARRQAQRTHVQRAGVPRMSPSKRDAAGEADARPRTSFALASLNCTTGCVSQNACRRCSASRRRTTCLGDGSARRHVRYASAHA